MMNGKNEPTRRSALSISAAAIVAGVTAPTMALAAAPNPDAELIALCDQFVAIQTEWWLLIDHDEWASQWGPNHARLEHLDNEKDRLSALIEECKSPTTLAGCAATARAAMTWAEVDDKGNIECDGNFEYLMVQVAEGMAPGFVWPPRPGSCSTAFWAPPPSPTEVAEHWAAHKARMAQIDAEIQAKKFADEAERRRIQMPSALTDDELRGQMKALRRMSAISAGINAELSAEIARRGLEVA